MNRVRGVVILTIAAGLCFASVAAGKDTSMGVSKDIFDKCTNRMNQVLQEVGNERGILLDELHSSKPWIDIAGNKITIQNDAADRYNILHGYEDFSSAERARLYKTDEISKCKADKQPLAKISFEEVERYGFRHIKMKIEGCHFENFERDGKPANHFGAYEFVFAPIGDKGCVIAEKKMKVIDGVMRDRHLHRHYEKRYKNDTEFEVNANIDTCNSLEKQSATCSKQAMGLSYCTGRAVQFGVPYVYMQSEKPCDFTLASTDMGDLHKDPGKCEKDAVLARCFKSWKKFSFHEFGSEGCKERQKSFAAILKHNCRKTLVNDQGDYADYVLVNSLGGSIGKDSPNPGSKIDK